MNTEVKMNRRFVFLGLPGAGKGTQAAILSSLLKISHISTGEILRKERKNGTALGKQMQSCIDGGRLVPDEVILEVVREQVSHADASKGWILDGFPRNVSQASSLNALLTGIGQELDLVVYLEVPDSIVIPRLKERAIKENRRDDAEEELILYRLKDYHEQTFPLVELYAQREQLITINGNQSLESVTESIAQAVEAA